MSATQGLQSGSQTSCKRSVLKICATLAAIGIKRRLTTSCLKCTAIAPAILETQQDKDITSHYTQMLITLNSAVNHATGF